MPTRILERASYACVPFVSRVLGDVQARGASLKGVRLTVMVSSSPSPALIARLMTDNNSVQGSTSEVAEKAPYMSPKNVTGVFSGHLELSLSRIDGISFLHRGEDARNRVFATFTAASTGFDSDASTGCGNNGTYDLSIAVETTARKAPWSSTRCIEMHFGINMHFPCGNRRR